MKDSELYESIANVGLNEFEFRSAVVALKRAELFSDAVLFLVNAAQSLTYFVLNSARAKYRSPANEAA